MSHELKFTVHTVAEQMVDVQATVEGVKQTVHVPALVVELESACGSMFQTLRIRKNIDVAREEFVSGAEVTMTLKVAK